MQNPETGTAAPPQPTWSPPASPPPPRGSEYAQLSRQIKQAGLLERRRGYYICKIAVNALLLAGGWAAFVLVGN